MEIAYRGFVNLRFPYWNIPDLRIPDLCIPDNAYTEYAAAFERNAKSDRYVK